MKHVVRLNARLSVACLCLLAFTSFAKAEVMSCRSFAEAAANQWANGSIRPLGAADMGGHDEVTVISYGKKFAVPRRTQNDGNVILGGLGSLAQQRTEVYYEELARCQYRNQLSVHIYTK